MIKIGKDEDPMNPREECENLGVLHLPFHRNYRLGDKDSDSPFEDVIYYEYEGKELSEDNYELAIQAFEQLFEEMEKEEKDKPEPDDRQWLDTLEGIRELIDELEDLEQKEKQVLRKDVLLCHPVYLFDHGNIRLGAGPFHCKWDSGLLGFHYVTKKNAKECFGDIPDLEGKVKACMEAEFKTYCAYVEGEVWWVEDDDGPVCGFIGETLEFTGILDHFPPERAEEVKTAWENRYED